jgi:hypothetical protein
MTPLEIAKTDDSPYVSFNFDHNSYKMGGDSRPENAAGFYKPVIKWVKDLKGHLFFVADMNKDKPDYHRELNFEFHFDYLNSTSLKFIFDLLKEIENLNDAKHTARIIWYYLEGDELMQENGQDYAEIIKCELVMLERKASG